MDSGVLCRFYRELREDDWFLTRLHQYAPVRFQVDLSRNLARTAAQMLEQRGTCADPVQGICKHQEWQTGEVTKRT
jgi:hypothetical protein